MADVLTTADPTTLAAVSLAQLIIDGGDLTAFNTAVNELSDILDFPLPFLGTYDAFVAAGPPPTTTTFGENAPAFQSWLASLS